MQPDEMFAFKLYDSDPSRPQWTGHTAIVDPETPARRAAASEHGDPDDLLHRVAGTGWEAGTGGVFGASTGASPSALPSIGTRCGYCSPPR